MNYHLFQKDSQSVFSEKIKSKSKSQNRERIRKQKAKALAKSDELNRRSQAGDGSTKNIHIVRQEISYFIVCICF